jgi:hypothetical protein
MPWTPEQKRAKYAELRAKLERLLGSRCTMCGSESDWAVDHEGGARTYSARQMNSLTRLARYLAEAERGGIRRLCNSCNGADGDTRRWYRESLIDDTITT